MAPKARSEVEVWKEALTVTHTSLAPVPEMQAAFRVGVEIGGKYAIAKYLDDHPELDAENETPVPPTSADALRMGIT